MTQNNNEPTKKMHTGIYKLLLLTYRPKPHAHLRCREGELDSVPECDTFLNTLNAYIWGEENHSEHI